MNVSDSEIVLGILARDGYARVDRIDTADVVLINTCAIRDKAEQRVWNRLRSLRQELAAAQHNGQEDGKRTPAVVGILGCMAERLKSRLLEGDRLVDVVAGPDAYRDLPRILRTIRPSSNNDGSDSSASYEPAMNVQLSLEETYADVAPVREDGVRRAFISIMRGCNNMCAFCIVPFTRGRERSRAADSIVDEVRALSRSGVKEVVLLGQNVNSYADFTGSEGEPPPADIPKPPEADDPFRAYARGFVSVYKPKREGAVAFATLLDRVARVDPEMRVRFTSPHPKDFSDEVLEAIARHPNVGSCLHMPAQSGSSACLARMKRGYTRESYSALIRHARAKIPGLTFSSDIIVGFCGETEEEHAATLSLLREVGFAKCFIFAYSLRDKTHAARRLVDDVPEAVKRRRLNEALDVYREALGRQLAAEVGRTHLVMVDGWARRGASDGRMQGRTCTNIRVTFDAAVEEGDEEGTYLEVLITGWANESLTGRRVGPSSLQAFHAKHGSMSYG